MPSPRCRPDRPVLVGKEAADLRGLPMLLTENNIKSELSYAYLHAVASRAGLECAVAGRHSDGAGVDAVLRARERFSTDSLFVDFTVDIQLKATGKAPILQDGRYSFALKIDHYNKLRATETLASRLLVVLFMPEDPSEWLVHSEESLTARRCAYWTSLRGAPASDNKTEQTVHIDKKNGFSAESLRSLMARLSRGEKISYVV